MAKKKLPTRKEILANIANARPSTGVPWDERVWVCPHGHVQQGAHTLHCRPRDPMEPVKLTPEMQMAMEIGAKMKRTLWIQG